MYRDEEKAAEERARQLKEQVEYERQKRDLEQQKNDLLESQLRPNNRSLPPSNAGAILTLGILGLFCGILAPIAWVMGSDTLKKMDRKQMQDHNRGTASAGMVLGIVGSALVGLFLLIRIASIGA